MVFLWQRLQSLTENPFVRHVSWLGGSEILVRVVRLLTLVGVTRLMDPVEYGLAAIVLATHELIYGLGKVGLETKLIQAQSERLPLLLNSAYWLNWILYGGLLLTQWAVAVPLAWFYHQPRLIGLIGGMALIYVVLPFSLIQMALVRRENRLKEVAFITGGLLSLDNGLTLLLVWLGWGLWGIVAPKVIVAVIWAAVLQTRHPWRPDGSWTTEYWGELVDFAHNILGVEALKLLRNNLDYFLIGGWVGVKELGLYYFCFNIGLGTSLSLIQAVNAALLPHLCAVRAQVDIFRQRYLQSLRTITLLIVPLVVLQAGLAPWYVPLVFGAQWIPGIPVLMLICLSAIPRAFADAASQLLMAVGRPRWDLIWNGVFTVLFGLGLLGAVVWPWGSVDPIVRVALAILVIHLIFPPLFTVCTSRTVLGQLKTDTLN